MPYRHIQAKYSRAVGNMLWTATHTAAAALTPHIAAIGQSSRERGSPAALAPGDRA